MIIRDAAVVISPRFLAPLSAVKFQKAVPKLRVLVPAHALLPASVVYEWVNNRDNIVRVLGSRGFGGLGLAQPLPGQAFLYSLFAVISLRFLRSLPLFGQRTRSNCLTTQGNTSVG